MKHIIRIFIAGFLLLLTFSTAAYRLNPTVSPEVTEAKQESLADRVTGALTSIRQRVTGAAVDMAVEAVTDVTPTGETTETGSEILHVDVPASAVSAVTSQVSEELGGMVTVPELVEGLNGMEGVAASQNQDGSVSVTLPEEIYEQYKDEIAHYLGN